MHRRITLAGFTVLACLFCVVADSPAADAQGLFRRLQERVRSRAEELPDPPTPPGEPRYAPNLQPVAPQKAEPSTSGDANRLGQSVLRRGQIPAAASQREATQSSPAAGPSLGVSVVESEEGVPGLKIAVVRTDSLADEAGLNEGDLIIAIDGKPTPSIQSVVELLATRRVGDRVRVTVVRDTTTETITLGLVESVVSKAKPVPDAKEKKEKANESDGDPSVIQAGFESVGGATTKKLKKDPPSLKGLELPPRESIPIELNPPAPVPTKAEAIESLRDQIRQLEARLKQLESEA